MLTSSSPAAVTPSVAWKNYVNVRFGYQICYPIAALMPIGESDNSDGQTFKGHNGGELLVFGSYNVEHSSLSDEARSQARSYMGKSGRILYRASKAGWVVLSGNDGRSVDFYNKTIQQDDRFITFQLKYPHSRAWQYRPMVKRLSECFRVTKGHV